jgi:hypothetical protein
MGDELALRVRVTQPHEQSVSHLGSAARLDVHIAQ